ncbi:MAG: hypothetical protein SFX73_21490 [Kofleriaceae bacterium]|nr:hypothetical protein [Kofleriaceae bacterium]
MKLPDAEANIAAVLVGASVSRVLGRFFLRCDVHRCPTALFGEEEGAVRWLLEQRND